MKNKTFRFASAVGETSVPYDRTIRRLEHGTTLEEETARMKKRYADQLANSEFRINDSSEGKKK